MNKGHENLIPQNKRSKAEQRKIASMGGKASGVAKRQKKTMRECFETLAKQPIPEKIRLSLAKSGQDLPEGTTYYEALTFSMMLNGIAKCDTRAISLIMDCMGEKMADQLKKREIEAQERLQVEEPENIDELSKSLMSIADNLESD